MKNRILYFPEQGKVALDADYALDTFDSDFAEKAKTLPAGGANVAVEVTGLGKGLDQVLDSMRKFGRVALLGCTRNSDFTKVYERIASPLDADKIYDELINDRSFPVTLFDRDTVED